jgi:enolase
LKEEKPLENNKARLEGGWTLANHILVSFHIAFILSLFNLPLEIVGTWSVLCFVFASYDTVISAFFWFSVAIIAIGIHERGHFIAAVKQKVLTSKYLPEAEKKLNGSFFTRILYNICMVLKIPFGKCDGVKREGLTYYSENPFNLAVAASGPRASRNTARIALPLSIVFLTFGLLIFCDIFSLFATISIYLGRWFFGIGAVTFLDYKVADPGKFKEFEEREKVAKDLADKITTPSPWATMAGEIKIYMARNRLQEIQYNGTILKAPWQFRNCGMGGRHTEKQYPESNVSMQEMMFVPLCAKSYEEAQEITIALQTRLQQFIDMTEGCRVMGVGLEGGIAPYISKKPDDKVPSLTLWRMALTTIEQCGYRPGRDVAIALDPAASELSIAYRKDHNQPDAIGMYLFWRDAERVVMTNDELLDIYIKAIEEGIPIISIEDGFDEHDNDAWRKMMKRLNDVIFIIGDDNITTNDASIEKAADSNEINSALIKINQIGTPTECILAILVALGKGLYVVPSHRSKSPNDDIEAHIALACGALGLKAGGGANTERLFKYNAITKLFKKYAKVGELSTNQDSLSANKMAKKFFSELVITDIDPYEEPTNAGIPTVGAMSAMALPGDNRKYTATGATPLGTSAGTGEAIHLVDEIIRPSIIIERYPECFVRTKDGNYMFKDTISLEKIEGKNDTELLKTYKRSKRFNGKGCLNAVENVEKIIASAFIGKKILDLSILDIDRTLLRLELETAIKADKIRENASNPEKIAIMQRKGQLGMNAILSVSLSLARLLAIAQGKELWQLLREMLVTTMAKMISANGGLDLLPNYVAQKIKVGDDQELWEAIAEQLAFEELVQGLQAVNREKPNIKFYSLLRKQLPVYEV